MNREIKVRIWDGLNKIMYTSPVYCMEIMCDIIAKVASKLYMPLAYTGLKDKNGIEIYEGYILQYTEHEGYLMGSCKMLICWDDEMAGFGYKMDSPHDFFRSFWNHDELKEDVLNHCEVIGNIYENPELLVSKI